ncbi:hypothetical protein KSF78_0005542 [Schistosoma japonicum]|nr:hypothetical protein KSF78_0005542 [Schistosoma japonicum]
MLLLRSRYLCVNNSLYFPIVIIVLHIGFLFFLINQHQLFSSTHIYLCIPTCGCSPIDRFYHLPLVVLLMLLLLFTSLSSSYFMIISMLLVCMCVCEFCVCIKFSRFYNRRFIIFRSKYTFFIDLF